MIFEEALEFCGKIAFVKHNEGNETILTKVFKNDDEVFAIFIEDGTVYMLNMEYDELTTAFVKRNPLITSISHKRVLSAFFRALNNPDELIIIEEGKTVTITLQFGKLRHKGRLVLPLERAPQNAFNEIFFTPLMDYMFEKGTLDDFLDHQKDVSLELEMTEDLEQSLNSADPEQTQSIQQSLLYLSENSIEITDESQNMNTYTTTIVTRKKKRKRRL
ncbi:hypothetical protein PCE1_003863 [Barthelona sp. PCE]